MSTIATRTGDDGNTSLFGGGRVAKDHPRVEAYGAVDELNSWIGLVRAERVHDESERALDRIQNDLFRLGAELATRREDNPSAAKVAPFGDAPLAMLDQWIAAVEPTLRPLDAFILPGGTRAAALLHVSRCVCRRAERAAVTLAHQERITASVIRYLNRLSDVLFLMARHENAQSGKAETRWIP